MGTNAGLYYAAAFLDPSSFIFMPKAAQEKAEEWLKDKLCVYEEVSRPKNTDSPDEDVNGNLTFECMPCFEGLQDRETDLPPQDSAADLAIKEYKASMLALMNMKTTVVIPPDATVEQKVILKKAAQEEVMNRFASIDPLVFYAELELENKNYLLRKWAAIVLPFRITEAHIESVFAKAGRTYDVLRAGRFSNDTGSRLTFLRLAYLYNQQVEEEKRMLLSKEKCKKFVKIVGDKLLVSEVADDADEEEDEEEQQQAGTFDAKVWYEAPIKPCPERTKDLNENISVAVYFEDINKWERGKIVLINRRIKVTDKKNVTVDYGSEGTWNFCLHPETYGPDKFWVLPDESEELNDEETKT